MSRSLSGTGMFDIVFSALVLFPWLFGVLGDGFWDLAPEQVTLTLPPVRAEPAPADVSATDPVR